MPVAQCGPALSYEEVVFPESVAQLSSWSKKQSSFTTEVKLWTLNSLSSNVLRSTTPEGSAESVWLSSDLLCAFMFNSAPWLLLKLLGFFLTALECPRISLGWVSGVSPTLSGSTHGAGGHWDTASSESLSWRN